MKTPDNPEGESWRVSALRLLPLCGQGTDKLSRWLTLAAFFIYLAYNYYQVVVLDQAEWDYLLLTGIATLWLGLVAVSSIGDEFANLVIRLIERGVLPRDIDRSGLLRLLEDRSDLHARGISLLSAVAMATAFIAWMYDDPRGDRVLLAALATAGAYIAGAYLGRMVSYGRLATHVTEAGWSIRIFPEHVDGVGGLKPVGDFYFRQAMIAAIPVLFLGIWSILFPHWDGRNYSGWADPYLGLLVVALAIMLSAFVVPMIKFHNLMVEKKREALLEADRLSRQVREERNSADPAAEITDVADRIEVLRKRYWNIETMPVWPLHVSTLKRFRRNYLVLTAPLITRLIDDNTKVGEQVAALFRTLGGS